MNNIAKIIADNVNGSTFVGIDTITNVKLSGGKKNELQGRVTKKQVGSSVMVFQNKTTNGYENMVHRRLEQEGIKPESFVLGPRKWGTRIENLPFVEHKGGYYLEVIFLKPGNVTYLVDGIETDKSQITGLPVTVPSKQGGLEKKVQIRTPKIESITQLTINKKSYSDLTFKL
jgi:hypothetical protein